MPITWRNVATQSQTGNLNAIGEAGRNISSGLKSIGNTIGQVAKTAQDETQQLRNDNTQKILNNISSLDQAGLDEANASGQFGLDSLRASGYNPQEVSKLSAAVKAQGSALENKQRADDAYDFKQGQQQRTLDKQKREDSELFAGRSLDSFVLNNRFNDFGGNPQKFVQAMQSTPEYLNASADKQLQIEDAARKQFEAVRQMSDLQRSQHAALNQTAQDNISALTQNHQQRLSVLATDNKVGVYSGNVEDQGVKDTIADINSRDDGEGLQIYGRVTEALGFAPNGDVFRDIIARGRDKGSEWFTSESGGLDVAIKEFRESTKDSNLNKYLREKAALDTTFNANVSAANAVPSSFSANARTSNRTGDAQKEGKSFNLLSRLTPDSPAPAKPKVSSEDITAKPKSDPNKKWMRGGQMLSQNDIDFSSNRGGTLKETITNVDSYGLKGTYNSGAEGANAVRAELTRREKAGTLDKDTSKFLAELKRREERDKSRAARGNSDVPN